MSWWDELNSPDFQDAPVDWHTKNDRRIQTFHHQPITASNRNILHAITGVDTGYKIGSVDEYRFYVIMENDPESVGRKDPRRLFFNSPDEYEAATGINVCAKGRDRWTEKQLKLYLGEL